MLGRIILYKLFGPCIVGLLYACITVQYAWAIIIPCAICFYYLAKYYLSASRETKRLVQLAESPIFAHFEECLTGLQIIRNGGYVDM